MPSIRTIIIQAAFTAATMYAVNKLAASNPSVRQVVGGSNLGFIERNLQALGF